MVPRVTELQWWRQYINPKPTKFQRLYGINYANHPTNMVPSLENLGLLERSTSIYNTITIYIQSDRKIYLGKTEERVLVNEIQFTFKRITAFFSF